MLFATVQTQKQMEAILYPQPEGEHQCPLVSIHVRTSHCKEPGISESHTIMLTKNSSYFKEQISKVTCET